MMYSLYFDLKVTPDKKLILEMFFKDWADRICNNEVTYSFVPGSYCDNSPRTIRVDFVNEEDAVAMKLRGVPDEFKNYLTLV
jgi:hypothetical protein